MYGQLLPPACICDECDRMKGRPIFRPFGPGKMLDRGIYRTNRRLRKGRLALHQLPVPLPARPDVMRSSYGQSVFPSKINKLINSLCQGYSTHEKKGQTKKSVFITCAEALPKILIFLLPTSVSACNRAGAGAVSRLSIVNVAIIQSPQAPVLRRFA